MIRRGWGRIVAINSVSTKQPIPDLALSNALRPSYLAPEDGDAIVLGLLENVYCRSTTATRA